MLIKNVEKAINSQVLIEAYSSQLYLAMAAWSENKGFAGASKFLYHHAEEERIHMLKLIHYLNDRGGKVIIPALDAPPPDYKDIISLFGEIMKHEVFVTASINKLLETCLKEKDFNTANFLQWYVMEQVEEESLFRTILDKINLLGKEKAMFYLIDKELEGMVPVSGAKA